MLKISNIRGALKDQDYAALIASQLNISKKKISQIQLLRRSIDARRAHVHFIYNFAFKYPDEEELLKKYKTLTRYQPYHYTYKPSTDTLVTVVGSGPAGLFTSYVLAKSGNKVRLIERGSAIEKRIKDVEALFDYGHLNPQSNIAFGEGGAGTFSDGKLTTSTKDARVRYVIDTFLAHGAPQEIVYDAMPHIGTDRLRQVMISMRQEMRQLGVEILFDTTFVDFYEDHAKRFVTCVKAGEQVTFETGYLVLALGHSARDTFSSLNHKLEIVPKSFAVGVRIEQLQEKINRIQYKADAASPYLGPAPYKLTARTKSGRGVYTFCMCPGGEVVCSTESSDGLCVNGMSYYDRAGENANSAILVQVTPDDFPAGALGGIAFQRELERRALKQGGGHLYAPVQRTEDYLADRPSESLGKIEPTYRPGYTLSDLNQLFPDFINEPLKEGLLVMNKKMPGFIDEDTILTGVESRSSSPVRITRDKEMRATRCPWVYPAGEGAGYSGGIISSAVDGIKIAEKILERDE